MSKKDVIEFSGVVTQALSKGNFRVKLDNGHEVLCTLSGKIRQNYIKILVGDPVYVEVSMYDLNRGRIFRRGHIGVTRDDGVSEYHRKRK